MACNYNSIRIQEIISKESINFLHNSATEPFEFVFDFRYLFAAFVPMPLPTLLSIFHSIYPPFIPMALGLPCILYIRLKDERLLIVQRE
jgi:hypothetical protein